MNDSIVVTVTIQVRASGAVYVESSPPGIPFEVIEAGLGRALEAARKIRAGKAV